MVNRGFELMNSFEVMIICLLDGCISKKIPTDFKIRGGGLSASRLPACSAVDWTFKGGLKNHSIRLEFPRWIGYGWKAAGLRPACSAVDWTSEGGAKPKKNF